MQYRTVAAVAVALLVVCSGCSALGGSQAEDPSNETEAETDELADATNESQIDDDGTTDTNESGSEDVESDTDTGESDSQNETGSENEDTTSDETWSPPQEPNRPLEDKREDRIESVEFVDKEPAKDGEGYSNFNLKVVANTSMEVVDPPEHGNVVGEPYFFVKINEGPDNRKIVERTGQVRMAENGTYHIDVRPAGIEEFGEGPLTVEVFLMDKDKDWDDIYDAVGTKIHFNPDTETDANGGETDGSTGEETDGGSQSDAGAADSESNGSESGES